MISGSDKCDSSVDLRVCDFQMFETTENFAIDGEESDVIELKTFNTLDKLREELWNVEGAKIRAFRQHDNKFNLLYAGNNWHANSKEVTLANPKYALEIGSLNSEVDKLSFSHNETIKAI
ncbi:unnamed protein product [Brachionus calyciflorus]|uniref:Uncharacterized protein n=1 Tax=Brachionus calyciflorus TaxID=104777 RepID=A0A813Z1F9_9BILA|nr:unnamed protein product [Brachionus calyciflorus]